MQYFEDFHVGDKTVTRARTVTEVDMVSLAAVGGNWHRLYNNIEYAKKTQFGEGIAQGMPVLSLASGHFSFERILQRAFVAFYGVDRVRFVAPTKISDTLYVGLEVVDKQDKERDGVVSSRQVVENQNGEEVVASIMKLLIGLIVN